MAALRGWEEDLRHQPAHSPVLDARDPRVELVLNAVRVEEEDEGVPDARGHSSDRMEEVR